MNPNFKFKPIQEKPKKFQFSSWQKKTLKTSLIAGGSLIILLIILIIGLLIQGQTKFDISKINLEITGPEIIQASEQITYKIKYSNQSAIALQKLKLILDFPENFNPVQEQNIFELDLLNPGQEQEIEIKGRLLGQESSEHKIKAILYYKPENFKSEFKKQAEFTTLINSSSILLLWQGPGQAADKQKIDLELSYLNKQESIFKDFQIQINLPKNFELLKSSPDPDKQESEKLIYFIGALEKDVLKKIEINGIINKESKFKAELGVLENDKLDIYAQKELTISLIQIQAGISQVINNQENYIANPGDVLEYKLVYNNPDNLLISNAIIKCKLNSEVFDLSSVKAENAVFNQEQKEIIWQNIEIAPQEQGSVAFFVKLKDKMPNQNFNDKNFTAKTVTVLEADNFKTQHELEVKINSHVDLQVKAYYNEQSVNIQNFGPIPLKAGQATTYTIHWQITNETNDLENVMVQAGLPSNIKCTGETSVSSGAVSCDDQKVIWSISELSAHTGKLAPLQEAVFQIKLIPKTENIGKPVVIINDANLSAYDTFTEQTLSDSQLYINTAVDSDDGIVGE